MAADDADLYLSQLGERVAPLGRRLHEHLVNEGCKCYVKTIYVGYEVDGLMVAALYGRADHVELALALAENDPSPSLKDASHLTWRTLPVALDVRTNDDVAVARHLVEQACERIRAGIHDVQRDNEHFIRSRRERLRGPKG